MDNIKKLGFGLMRLPRLGEQVDIEQVKQMVDLFLDKGFSYFDTSWGYANSEESIKLALIDRYPRERYQFATKMPAWVIPSAEEAKRMFQISMERTGLDYFDFYLLHNLGGKQNSRTETFEQYGIWEYLQEQKKEGRIRNLGFSIHATADHLDEVLTRHPDVDFVQLQINYADWNNTIIQSGKCYEVARKHEKPIVIMEPVKGGALANPPKQVADFLTQANPAASLASWGIRYAASLEGIITVLSGMSTLEQMQDNLATMDNFQPMSKDELNIIRQAQEMLDGIPRVQCTDCQYCVKGCPQSIAIPGIFKAVNDYLIYKGAFAFTAFYNAETTGGGNASDCIACGRCEKVCPQSISIIEELSKAANYAKEIIRSPTPRG